MVRLDRVTTAHDVGRAINPLLVEGQIEGGVAQGIGMALMEDYQPGRTENLHDYLIPTIGDVPVFDHVIVEVADAEGPYGAKGLGEHVLINSTSYFERYPARNRGFYPSSSSNPRQGRGRDCCGKTDEPRMTETSRDQRVEQKIRCDACPVMCYIADGKSGACDRYANEQGQLVRLDPLVVMQRKVDTGGNPGAVS